MVGSIVTLHVLCLDGTTSGFPASDWAVIGVYPVPKMFDGRPAIMLKLTPWLAVVLPAVWRKT